MSEVEFLSKMKQILNGTDILFDSQLSTIEEWDSLATVNFMSLFSLEGREIMELLKKAETVRELYEVVNKRF